MICPNCNKEIKSADHRFCGFCGAPLKVLVSEDGKMRKRILDEAWESGKEQGRKEEREHSANETKIFLWASILLGAIAGGVIGAQTTELGGNSALRMVIGILIGGLLGGLHFFFGCCLTIIIFILGVVGVAMCMVK